MLHKETGTSGHKLRSGTTRNSCSHPLIGLLVDGMRFRLHVKKKFYRYKQANINREEFLFIS